MSKEFDEFMNSMSEIPTNSSNSEKPNMCDVREDDVEKLEENYWKELENRREVAKNFKGQVAGRHPDMFGHSEMMHMLRGYLEGYNKAKENTYTEEQVREAINLATTSKYDYKLHFYNADEIIQSLKQPKQ